MNEALLALRACCKAGRWRHAIAIVTDLWNAGMSPNTVQCGEVLSCLEKSRQWWRAIAFLSAMHRRVRTDIVSFNIAMNACDKAGRWEHALAILHKTVEQKLHPTMVTYGTAISASGRGHRWLQVLEILNSVQKEIGAPGLILCNAVLRALEAAHIWHVALVHLAKMQQSGPLPNFISWNAVLGACGRSHQWPTALFLLATMDRMGTKPNVQSYNKALRGLKNSDRWQLALELLTNAQQHRLEANEVSYSDLFIACRNKGNWRIVVALLAQMRMLALSPDAAALRAAHNICGIGLNANAAGHLLQLILLEIWSIHKSRLSGQDVHDAVLLHEALGSTNFSRPSGDFVAFERRLGAPIIRRLVRLARPLKLGATWPGGARWRDPILEDIDIWSSSSARAACEVCTHVIAAAG